LLSCFFAFLLFPNICSADGLVPNASIDQGTTYTLNEMVSVATKIAAWILSITGSLSLLFFIYGGTMFLISGGIQERVTKAKNILSGAVIGAVIVLTSFIIINFLITSLRGDSAKEWYKLTTKTTK